MNSENDIRLFLYNCAVINSDMKGVNWEKKDKTTKIIDELTPYIKQFDQADREKAISMAQWYVLFYLLENDIRSLVRNTLT